MSLPTDGYYLDERGKKKIEKRDGSFLIFKLPQVLNADPEQDYFSRMPADMLDSIREYLPPREAHQVFSTSRKLRKYLKSENVQRSLLRYWEKHYGDSPRPTHLMKSLIQMDCDFSDLYASIRHYLDKYHLRQKRLDFGVDSIMMILSARWNLVGNVKVEPATKDIAFQLAAHYDSPDVLKKLISGVKVSAIIDIAKRNISLSSSKTILEYSKTKFSANVCLSLIWYSLEVGFTEVDIPKLSYLLSQVEYSSNKETMILLNCIKDQDIPGMKEYLLGPNEEFRFTIHTAAEDPESDVTISVSGNRFFKFQIFILEGLFVARRGEEKYWSLLDVILIKMGAKVLMEFCLKHEFYNCVERILEEMQQENRSLTYEKSTFQFYPHAKRFLAEYPNLIKLTP